MMTVPPAKDNRGARGRRRARHGVLEAHAGTQLLLVAGDDEQRVVDADAEAEAERGREGWHLDHVPDQRHKREAAGEACERDDDG
jgi:hypothetical protein